MAVTRTEPFTIENVSYKIKQLGHIIPKIEANYRYVVSFYISDIPRHVGYFVAETCSCHL